MKNQANPTIIQISTPPKAAVLVDEVNSIRLHLSHGCPTMTMKMTVMMTVEKVEEA